VYSWSSACNSRVQDKLTTIHSHCPWSRNECEKGKEKKKANLIHSELSVVLEYFTTLISSRFSRCVSGSFRDKCFNIPSNTTRFFLFQNVHIPVSIDRNQGISTLFKNSVKYNILNHYVLRFYLVLKHYTDGLLRPKHVGVLK
jgi:hypothetical protein